MVPEESFASLYYRLANKNINIINCSSNPQQCVLIVEYQYNRPSDNKLVWPKIAILGDTPEEAIGEVEETVDKIRSGE